MNELDNMKKLMEAVKPLFEASKSHAIDSYVMTRDGEKDVVVTFNYYQGYPQTRMEPEEPPEIEIFSVKGADGVELIDKVSEKALARFEDEVHNWAAQQDSGDDDYSHDTSLDYPTLGDV